MDTGYRPPPKTTLKTFHFSLDRDVYKRAKYSSTNISTERLVREKKTSMIVCTKRNPMVGKCTSRSRTASKATTGSAIVVYVCVYLVYTSLQVLPNATRTLEKLIDSDGTGDSVKLIDKTFGRAVLNITFESESIQSVAPAIYGNVTIISWDGLDDINIPAKQFWNGKLLCNINEIRSLATKRDLPILINITFGCNDLYHEGRLGTGNYVMLFYGIRLVARIFGNVDVSIHCHDASQTKKDLVIPWLMGWFPGRPILQHNSIPLSANTLCNRYQMPPLTYMYKEIQYDLRNMAIGLLGIPRPDHPSAKYAERNLWPQKFGPTDTSAALGISSISPPAKNDASLYTADEYELDDAVLHFRCGDLMDSDHPHFAFMKFSGYTRHISLEASSIGIITQPFDEGTQTRALDMDQHKRDRCRVVVHSLLKYIKDRHPNARVRIRNGVNETIALTYARMIMANQSIVGISTFSVLPTIATFGTGYIRLPGEVQTQNLWLSRPRIDNFTSNVVFYEEPNIIMVSDMKELWKNEGEIGVLNWFWNDAMEYAIPNQYSE